MKRTHFLFIAGITSCLFFGCKNIEEPENHSSKLITVSGTIQSMKNGSKTNHSRQAFPSAPANEIGELFFTVTSEIQGKTYSGTVNKEENQDSPAFSIGIPEGTENAEITAEAYLDSDLKQKIYRGTFTFENTNSNTSGNTIVLRDIQEGTEKTSTVSLPIQIASDAQISKITAEWNAGTSSNSSASLELTQQTGETTYYFDFAGFKTSPSTEKTVPGNFNVVLSFFISDAKQNSILVYSTRQIITASNCMTTEKWTNLGTESCIQDGIMKITKDLCDKSKSRSYYVDATIQDDSAASGSYSNPFKSIQRAVDAIKVRGITESCTICLKADIPATSYTANDFTDGWLVKLEDGDNLSITIDGFKDPGTDMIESDTVTAHTIDVGNTENFLYIGQGNSIQLENISLISSGAGASVYLSDNATISFNEMINSTNKGSIVIDIPEANYKTGTKILSDSTYGFTVFMKKEGWAIDSDGNLAEAITSWQELKNKIQTESTQQGFNLSYTIGNIGDFDNSTIQLSGINAADSLSILPSKNLSITANGLAQLSSSYFQISNISATIGSEGYKITFGDSAIQQTSNFISIISDGTATLQNCEFINANTNAIESNGTLSLSGCAFRNISIPGDTGTSNGVVYVSEGTTTIDNCTFTDCTGYDIYIKKNGKIILETISSDISIYVEDYSLSNIITLGGEFSYSFYEPFSDRLIKESKVNVKIYSYIAGTALFAPFTQNSTAPLTEYNINAFSVTDENGTEYTINTDGTLTAKQ